MAAKATPTTTTTAMIGPRLPPPPLGGGPGGYEAALVAAQLGARVTIVEKDGLGGAAVLTDCVPSKALIATADYMSDFEVASGLGVRLQDDEGDEVSDAVVQAATVNGRILQLAAAQSADIQTSLEQVGVTVLHGRARIVSRELVAADLADETASVIELIVKSGRPPYHQLMRELEETSYSAVGRKYGVSDNAIRKWVRAYEREMQQLPRAA